MILPIVIIYFELLSFHLCCKATVLEILNGHKYTSIPTNITASVTTLEIYNTRITTLNLQQLSVHTELCKIEVRKSPINAIIPPSQKTKLTSLRIIDAFFPVLPDLGDYLPGHLRYCTLPENVISTIPNNAFVPYVKLLSLSLHGNPIKFLNSSMMQGLTKLKYIYLGNTELNPLPEIHLWTPNVLLLGINTMELAEIKGSLIANLPKLQNLQANKNQLTSLPSREYFVNLESMFTINIERNPLECDYRLCWLKVITDQHPF